MKPMGRLVSALLAVLLVGAIADAKTPLRKCRPACKPLVSSACPAKGKLLRKCRTAILRECRRDGVAACAFGLPGSPGDGTTTPTTMPGQSTTSTSVTTTTSPGATTTTLAPADVPSVAGNWTFDGTLAQPGCNLNVDIESSLVVSQDAGTLYGTMEGHAAAGSVSASGWSFEWNVGNLQAAGATCARHFVITATGVTSPAAAEGVAAATCTDGSSCEARWTGSVTRVQ